MAVMNRGEALAPTITMQFLRSTSTVAVVLLFGGIVPAYAQHEQQPEKQAQPEKQQSKPQQAARPSAKQQRPQAQPQRAQTREPNRLRSSNPGRRRPNRLSRLGNRKGSLRGRRQSRGKSSTGG